MGSTLNRPLIGVTPTWQHGQEFLGEKFLPNEAISQGVFNSLVAAGAMPIMIPITADEELIERYVDLCDGFCLPGGHSVDPRRWGEKPVDEHDMAPERDALEFPLVEKVMTRDKPLLCICRGMQLLNVALGGTLSQCLYDLEPRPGTQHWRHGVILRNPAHPVEPVAGTLLASIVETDSCFQVNSSHHECVLKLGQGIRVNGYATDGIIESIDVPSQRFCLGVQWHPEYTSTTLETDAKLWRAFVAAAAEVKSTKNKA
ncbi:MAG: gamma-glutamyl-gamma-aminobutyrate hydrolase family protein [Atopobiaceae bacterium]|jgi:putative glutamine amidotransferase